MRNISDTARWVAAYRAHESKRPDALFNDPFAAALAGPEGENAAREMSKLSRHEWAFPIRTILFDALIEDCVRRGVDTVVNLAAGLDARPYRMKLPRSLRWVEVDLPELIEYKEAVLAAAEPVCQLARYKADLADSGTRRGLFAELQGLGSKTLILSEGLLIYLEQADVEALAADLAAQPSFRHWIMDIVSPGLLGLIRREWGKELAAANAPPKFGPEEGPPFFKRFGWQPVRVESFLKTAARKKRVPLLFRLAALIPESTGRQGKRPWSGVCLFSKTEGGA